MMPFNLSLIIPTHQRTASLLRLLNSIEKVGDLDLISEILIVSNLPEPYFESSEFLHKTKDLPVQVFVMNSVGVNKARNFGLQKAQAPISLLFDDDCLVDDPHFFKKIVNAHKTFPQAIAIGGLYQSPEQALSIDKAYCIAASSWQEPHNYGESLSSRLVGGNVSYKTQMIRDCGLKFNENILFGGTESEFHDRLTKQGFELRLLPELILTHFTQLDFNSFIRKAFHQAKGFYRFQMDGGSLQFSYKSYHDLIWVKAFDHASHLVEYEEIVTFLKLYDWAFQLTLKEPELSESSVLSQARAQQTKMKIEKSSLKVLKNEPTRALRGRHV